MSSSPLILLRSSWQTVNIGDIAHTPGMLRLLARHLPDARVVLWAGSVDRGVRELLLRTSPNLTDVITLKDDAAAAIRSADLLLHGSGPSLVGEPEVRRWLEVHGTSRPWGALGITLDHVPPDLAELVHTARFLYTRETASLGVLARACTPASGFFPDATLACDLRDDARAEAFLVSQGLAHSGPPLSGRAQSALVRDGPTRDDVAQGGLALAAGGFLCVLPRLRRTPYYRIHPSDWWTPDRIREVDELNARHAEDDHAKLRQLIVRWVRETGRRVLVCPEMEYQLEIQRPLLIDPLPDDVKPHVVERRTYWLTDEATSVYAHAAGVISFECHSPLLALTVGTPGVYLRQPQDTLKGQMYPDLGLADRKLEIESTSAEALADRALRLLTDPARDTVTRAALDKAADLHAKAFAQVRVLLK